MNQIRRIICLITKVRKKLNSAIKSDQQPKDSKYNQDLKQEEDELDDPMDSIHIGIQDRANFAERVKRLANDGLASVVRLIQKECPDSIEDLDDDRLQIKTTRLNKKTFDQINA